MRAINIIATVAGVSALAGLAYASEKSSEFVDDVAFSAVFDEKLDLALKIMQAKGDMMAEGDRADYLVKRGVRLLADGQFDKRTVKLAQDPIWGTVYGTHALVPRYDVMHDYRGGVCLAIHATSPLGGGPTVAVACSEDAGDEQRLAAAEAIDKRRPAAKISATPAKLAS